MKTEHPAPWYWHEQDAIKDRDGQLVLTVSMGQIWTASAQARRLMVAAPEMRELLRDILGRRCDPGDCVICGVDLQRGEVHVSDCKLGVLLARVDTGLPKSIVQCLECGADLVVEDDGPWPCGHCNEDATE